MKYMLLVHHNEQNFAAFSEATRQEMLAESVQLTHQLHANGNICTRRRCSRRRRQLPFGCATANRSSPTDRSSRRGSSLPATF